MPILYKYLKDNQIFFKGIYISFDQAVGMKKLLVAAASEKSSHLHIKSLIIDDCGMSDEVFE